MSARLGSSKDARERAKVARKKTYHARRAAGLCVNCTGPTDHRSICRPCARYLEPIKAESRNRRLARQGKKSPARKNRCSTCGDLGHSLLTCELNDDESLNMTAEQKSIVKLKRHISDLKRDRLTSLGAQRMAETAVKRFDDSIEKKEVELQQLLMPKGTR